MLIVRSFRCQTDYKVFLFSNMKSNEVVVASPLLSCIHDANEFVYWLSCQFSTKFYYQIVECTKIDGVTYYNPFPRSIKKPTRVVSYPPCPLYLHIKRKRRKDREQRGLYYVL